MGKAILTFGDIEIEKNEFNHHKTPIFFFREGGGMQILRKY